MQTTGLDPVNVSLYILSRIVREQPYEFGEGYCDNRHLASVVLHEGRAQAITGGAEVNEVIYCPAIRAYRVTCASPGRDDEPCGSEAQIPVERLVTVHRSHHLWSECERRLPLTERSVL